MMLPLFLTLKKRRCYVTNANSHSPDSGSDPKIDGRCPIERFYISWRNSTIITDRSQQSIDISLFTRKPFDSTELAVILKNDYGADFLKVLRNGVFCSIDGIKTDMISHVYQYVEPWETIDGIRLMSLLDISAMKLHAIVQNGSRVKDFADIYFLLEKIPLSRMYQAYEAKYYPSSSAKVARMALQDYSLVNFEEPIMLVGSDFDWKKTTERLRQAIFNPSELFQPSESTKHLQPERSNQLKRRRGPGM